MEFVMFFFNCNGTYIIGFSRISLGDNGIYHQP